MLNTMLRTGIVSLLGLLILQCEGPEGPAGTDGNAAPYITVSPAMVTVMAGASETITAATVNGTSSSYSWASADEDVATVSSGGEVSGVSEGQTLVSVNTGGLSAVVIVRVTQSLASEVSFQDDILPMFTTNGFWYPGADKCTSCHFSNDEEAGSKHAMDLSTYAGHMAGADPDPVSGMGMPLYGNTMGQTDFDWDEAMLKRRLRNNRMPQSPAWEFRRDESNRNGPDIEFTGGHAGVIKPHLYTSWDDEENVANALGLIEAWVEALKAAGDPLSGNESITFSYMGNDNLTYADDIQSFFTQGDSWFPNSQPCVECHFANTEDSYHVMNLGTFEGMVRGADYDVDTGMGMSLFSAGMTSAGAEGIDWSTSRLRRRLRDNRMPPNMPFLLDESNRDGPTVQHPVTGTPVAATDLIGDWVTDGAQDN